MNVEEGDDERSEADDEMPIQGGTGEEEASRPVISLNSVVGITSPKTMKLVGEILGQKVVVMIDPGATHNFVSVEVV